MKLTPWMLTVAAFGVIALLAVGFLAKKLLATSVVEVKPPEPRVLPMAITAIEPGTVITRAHIGNGRALPGQELAKDTFTSVDGVIGRIARQPIEAAVPLQGSMFYAVGDHPGLTVSEGKQAVVVRVSETSAVLNQKLKPNQFVDVLLTIDSAANGGGRTRLQSTGGSARQNSAAYSDTMTATLFEGVKLLSVNRGYTTTALQSGESSSVTLELDKRQAQVVTLAQKKGEIDLVYNETGPGSGGLSIEGTDKDRITLQEILGIRPPEEEKKPFRTEHYRGSGGSTVYFDEYGDRLYGVGSGGDNSGDRLQSTGGSGGGWSTDAKPAEQKNNLARTESGAES
ncbi:MAG: Flp pilus assembly protein CpaB [Planctomycetota bacterium]